MKRTNYKWQDGALGRFVRAVYFALIVDCGLGKTSAAIQIALAKMLPVIVIAPGHQLCDQWRDEILDIAGQDQDIWVYDKPTETLQGEQYKEDFRKWLTA